MRDKRILIIWVLGLVIELLVLWFATKNFTAVSWITLAFTIVAFVSQFFVWRKNDFINFLIILEWLFPVFTLLFNLFCALLSDLLQVWHQ